MTTPAPATNNNNSNTAAVCKTPDLTITGHSIKPQPMPAGGVEAAGGRPVSAAAAAAAGKKPWGARTTPNSSGGGVDIGMTTPPSRRWVGEKWRSGGRCGWSACRCATAVDTPHTKQQSSIHKRSVSLCLRSVCHPASIPPQTLHAPHTHRLSSGGGSARKSQAGQTPPSAGVPPSLLKPTAASAARAQATIKPRSDEAVWKH